MLDKNKVVIGMSGGVDSTVAAYVLKEMGYEVIGISMKLWEDDSPDYVEVEGGCCSLSSFEDARRVAYNLDIPFYMVNFKENFKEKVIADFIDEYEHGRTPNPCIRCNRYLKFEDLLKKANELGAYYVATGHYAKIEYDEKTDRYLLKKSKEDRKDQTYALYNLTQEQLKHTLMPLGDFKSKGEVRKIAESLDLNIASKSDSQEICFIPDNDYTRFLEEHLTKPVKPGNFVDTDGNVLGRHKGIIYYTVGQRKGLGITFGKPMYVVAIKPETNEVVLGTNDEVFSEGLIADDTNFIAFDKLEVPMTLMGKIRYSAKPASCKVYPLENGKIKVMFDDMQRAVTPGQAVVFYDGDVLVGGATIVKSI